MAGQSVIKFKLVQGEAYVSIDSLVDHFEDEARSMDERAKGLPLGMDRGGQVGAAAVLRGEIRILREGQLDLLRL